MIPRKTDEGVMLNEDVCVVAQHIKLMILKLPTTFIREVEFALSLLLFDSGTREKEDEEEQKDEAGADLCHGRPYFEC